MITIKQARKWQEALLSGKYKQTRNVLNDGNGYCCLGVLCDIVIDRFDLTLDCDDFLVGELPEDQPNAPKWLDKLNTDLNDRIGVSFDILNDDNKFSFADIANVIELVYIH